MKVLNKFNFSRLGRCNLVVGKPEHIEEYLKELLELYSSRLYPQRFIMENYGSDVHHTKLVPMWEQWNLLVGTRGLFMVATTQSMDCIKAFHEALVGQEDRLVVRVGKSRLTSDNGCLISIAYTPADMEVVIRGEIEIR